MWHKRGPLLQGAYNLKFDKGSQQRNRVEARVRGDERVILCCTEALQQGWGKNLWRVVPKDLCHAYATNCTGMTDRLKKDTKEGQEWNGAGEQVAPTVIQHCFLLPPQWRYGFASSAISKYPNLVFHAKGSSDTVYILNISCHVRNHIVFTKPLQLFLQADFPQSNS